MGAPAIIGEGGPGPAMRLRLAGFAQTLRGAGLAIGHAEVQDAARLLASPLAARPESLRSALQALFCSRHADLQRFGDLFDAFWRGRGARRAAKVTARGLAARSPRSFETGPGAGDSRESLPENSIAPAPEGASAEGKGRKGGASVHDALAGKDIRKLANDRERAEALLLAERLARAMRARLTRRARARVRAAGGSICAPPSGAASRMAASRST